MKTKFALVLYSVAIISLVALTTAVIIRLIIMPPCTQTGNLCVIDGWSVAGLAGTVLAVAATVLAILGAVAVAAWWTSLNDRVDEQVTRLVTKFYEEQKAKNTAYLQELQKMFAPLETQLDILRNAVTNVDRLQNTMETGIQNLDQYQARLEHIIENAQESIAESQQLRQEVQRVIQSKKEE